MTRFLILGVLNFLCSVCLTGCGANGDDTVVDPDDWRSQVKVLRAGIKGSEEDPVVLRRWEGLQRYLEDATGIPIKFYEASDYNGIIQALASGQIDLASMGAGSFANVYAQIGDLADPIVTARDSWGERGYYTSIFVRAESEFQTIQDLRGKSLVYVDFNSTSGYIYPRWKMRDEGIDPDTFFGEAALGGGHLQAAMALANGQFDAGVLSSKTMNRMAKRGLAKAEDYRSIWFVGPIANSPYVMRSDTPQAFRDLVSGALMSLAFEEPEIMVQVGRTPGSAFSPVDLEFYDEIIDMREREIGQYRERFAARSGQ